jgi:putative spermidine/putrescine transport system substrate-binding protein
MGSVWSDQFASAIKAGTMPSNIKVAQISNPSFTGGASYLGIPNSSQNKVGARLLANWVLSPAAQNLIVGGTLNGFPVIPLSKLDSTITAAFAGVDIQNLRPGYLSANANDLKSKWASTVPGK